MFDLRTRGAPHTSTLNALDLNQPVVPSFALVGGDGHGSNLPLNGRNRCTTAKIKQRMKNRSWVTGLE